MLVELSERYAARVNAESGTWSGVTDDAVPLLMEYGTYSAVSAAKYLAEERSAAAI